MSLTLSEPEGWYTYCKHCGRIESGDGSAPAAFYGTDSSGTKGWQTPCECGETAKAFDVPLWCIVIREEWD